jgi:hypothetical protein
MIGQQGVLAETLIDHMMFSFLPQVDYHRDYSVGTHNPLGKVVNHCARIGTAVDVQIFPE